MLKPGMRVKLKDGFLGLKDSPWSGAWVTIVEKNINVPFWDAKGSNDLGIIAILPEEVDVFATCIAEVQDTQDIVAENNSTPTP